jgi:hypothetical protein
MLPPMELLAGRLVGFLADAPDDPVLLVGMMLLAWLPLCAVVLGVLAVAASVQYHLVRRRRAPLGFLLPPPTQRPLVTRRFITNARHTNGLMATTRLAVAVGIVLGFTVLLLVSSGPLLLSAVRR